MTAYVNRRFYKFASTFYKTTCKTWCGKSQISFPHHVLIMNLIQFYHMKATITLATYNFRGPFDQAPYDWPSRKPRMRKLITDDHFDIFGSQEGVLQQVNDILEDSAFAKIGNARDDFKDKGEHSCIFYNTNRFDLLDGGTFGLSETPDVPGVRSWNSCCPRIASWGKFLDKNTGKKFCYYNTHLDNQSELARINGIKMVVEHAAKNCEGLPLILSGDFNASPESETYRIAASLLRDSKAITKTPPQGPQRTFHKWGEYIGTDKENYPIDYIFVSEGIEVLSYLVDDSKPLGDFASDHFPVITEIRL